MTLIATLICLLLSRKSQEPWTVNPIDEVLRINICDRVQNSRFIGEERAHVWSHVLYDMVICLSDQQLVTGTAVLVAALKLLHVDGTITVYHFTVVTNLAWFSANTHLLSMLVVRSFDVSAKSDNSSSGVQPASERNEALKKHQPRQFRAKMPSLLRVIFMLVMAGMLLYASLVTGYEQWYDFVNCPAACTLPYPKGGEPRQWMVANVLLILYSYPLAVFLLWRRGREYWVNSALRRRLLDDRGIRRRGSESYGGGGGDGGGDGGGVLPRSTSPPLAVHEEQLVPLQLYELQSLAPSQRLQQNEVQAQAKKKGLTLSRACRAAFAAVWYLLASETSAVLVQIMWHVLGYYYTFTDRRLGHELMRDMGREEDIDAENSLGFGQLVPIFLLLLPVLQFSESVAGKFDVTILVPR